MSQSVNSHEWYGLVSTYKRQLIPNKFSVTGGIDVRYYVGHHKNEIIDLYSGEYYMDDTDRVNVKAVNNAAAKDPNWKYQKLGIGMSFIEIMTDIPIRKVSTDKVNTKFSTEQSQHSLPGR